MSIKVEIKGIDKVTKNLDAFYKELEKEADKVLEVGASDAEGFAKRNTPVDFGKLRQQIASEKVDKLKYRVVAGAPYSAYQEFGTRGLVDIPEGWEDIAIYWKADPLIKMTNVPPHPFMFPAFQEISKILPKDMEKMIEDLVKKYS